MINTREYTKGDDVDLTKGPIFQSFKINQVEEKPKESKVLNVDFSALLNPEQKNEIPVKQPSSEEVSYRSQSSHNRESYHSHHHSRSRSRSRCRCRSRSRSYHHHHSSSSNEYSYGMNDNHNDNWIRTGLIVKILNKKLGDGS